jgi:hypothetical protein
MSINLPYVFSPFFGLQPSVLNTNFPLYQSGISSPSLAKTAEIAAALGNAGNNICSRGVAYNSKYVVLGETKEVSKSNCFLLSPFS